MSVLVVPYPCQHLVLLVCLTVATRLYSAILHHFWLYSFLWSAYSSFYSALYRPVCPFLFTTEFLGVNSISLTQVLAEWTYCQFLLFVAFIFILLLFIAKVFKVIGVKIFNLYDYCILCPLLRNHCLSQGYKIPLCFLVEISLLYLLYLSLMPQIRIFPFQYPITIKDYTSLSLSLSLSLCLSLSLSVSLSLSHTHTHTHTQNRTEVMPFLWIR
jgi:hypothetical protein